MQQQDSPPFPGMTDPRVPLKTTLKGQGTPPDQDAREYRGLELQGTP